jgi:hypothetical protein
VKEHVIRLSGGAAEGTKISAELLRETLAVVLEGSRRALRMRTEGRSSARGPSPAWIEAATRFSVEIRAGSTVLAFEAPTLLEAAPEEFGQRELFPEVQVDRTSFDYFTDSLGHAIRGDIDSRLFDRGLLELFRRLNRIFSFGADRIEIGDSGAMDVRPTDVERIAELEARIPAPQYVRVAGRLDSIRHSDRTFTLVTAKHGERIRGIAEPEHMRRLQELWGRSAVVSGTAHFTAGGAALRIDADSIRESEPNSEALWGAAPKSLEQAPSAIRRVAQGPRSGLNAVIGRWPGVESDHEVERALELLS